MADGTVTDAASWGEMLQAIKMSKVRPGWDPTRPPPIAHMTHRQKLLEQRAYDPILGEFREPREDEARRQRDASAAVRTANRSKDKELAFSQTFDLINHRPKLRGGEALKSVAPPKHRVPSTRTSYDIISNVPHADDPWVPPDREVVPEHVPGSGKRRLAHKLYRNFDILSNRYKTDHELRSEIDTQAALQQSAQRYWETRVFNPVTAAYYNQQQEERDRARAQEREREHGEDALTKLPESYQVSEGAAYDIVSTHVRDAERMRAREALEQKRSIRRVTDQFEEHVRTEAENSRQQQLFRSLNRVSIRRHEEASLHGFDIISGQPLHGLGSKPVPQPVHVRRPKQPWEKLQEDASADKVADRTSVLSRSGRDAVAGPELATGHAPFARARTRDAMARPELATDRAPRTHMRTLAAPASAPAPALALAASEPTGPAREPSAGIQHRAARGTAVPALNLDLTRSQPQSGRAVRTGGFC